MEKIIIQRKMYTYNAYKRSLLPATMIHALVLLIPKENVPSHQPTHDDQRCYNKNFMAYAKTGLFYSSCVTAGTRHH